MHECVGFSQIRSQLYYHYKYNVHTQILSVLLVLPCSEEYQL